MSSCSSCTHLQCLSNDSLIHNWVAQTNEQATANYYNRNYPGSLKSQIADLAKKLRKERRERERLENLGISGPVPDTPPEEEADAAAAQKTFSAAAAATRRQSVEAATNRAIAVAAATATARRPKGPGPSTTRTVRASVLLLNSKSVNLSNAEGKEK